MSKPRPANAASPPRDLSTRALVIGGLGFLALLTALYLFVQSIGSAELESMVESAGIWGPLVYIAIKALTFTFAPLSAGPIQFASGILFGVIPGVLYSVLGEVIGGTVNVLIARLLGRRIVERFVGAAALARIDDFYERRLDDWKSLLAARLLLFSVYDFISYAVGLGHIRLSVYIIVSFVGGLIPTYIFVAIGNEAAQNQNVLLLFYVGAAALFVLWLLFRRPISRLWRKLQSKTRS
ncbi:MAG: VTT domain-containing protein [Chloroflexota bacterium]|nr:VTT domain-containing protein [Chloroflexota bacterium]MDE2853902.1 VTT domain-containing protein [Chloroflexota bacterium]MDE2946651.1 VTT domain-containing protein [Chloroflexota bacterium]